MKNKIKRFLKFNWLSKKFFIRLYLILFAFVIILRIIQNEVDNALIGIMLGQIVVLLGNLNFTKRGNKNYGYDLKNEIGLEKD